jgi:hypothetical protein
MYGRQMRSDRFIARYMRLAPILIDAAAAVVCVVDIKHGGEYILPYHFSDT